MKSRVWHRSRYNYFVEREEGVVGYNARTGAVALLSPKTAKILQHSNPITTSDIHEVNINELINMGFLHDGNEIEQILSKFEKAKEQNRILNFTILPTLSCNFSCDYCFQGGHEDGHTMSLKTQEATLDFIQSAIRPDQAITCTWFGGEPLLAKNIVFEMSQQIKRITNDRKANLLQMSIVTNAILLNSKTAEELAYNGIKQAQVSLDALVFKNTKKRGVLDSSRKPSIILKNLIAAREHLEVRIRINVSKQNSTEVREIVEILSENGFKDNYYIARIHNHESEFNTSAELKEDVSSCQKKGCSSCSPIDSEVQDFQTLSRSDYAHFERDFFLNHSETLQRIVQKLTPKSHFCSATLGNMFVIDPDGFISRCWHSAGSPSEAIGNVRDIANLISDSEISKSWDSFYPLAYPACKGCKVLPLCMGGCAHPRMFMETAKPPCESIKHQVQFCVDTLGGKIYIKPEHEKVIS